MAAPTDPMLGKDPAVVPISNSEIQTFKMCRRKWWLEYYRGMHNRHERKTGPLAMGTRIHLALEAYYAEGVDPVTAHQELIEATENDIIMSGYEPGDEFFKEADLGRIMLEGYMSWLEETGADSNLEVIGAEKKLSVPLFDGKVELRGKVDLRVRRKTDNVRMFMDHKTVASRDTYLKIAHMAEQLKLYMLLENMTEDKYRIDGSVYNLLKKVKRTAKATPPFYERIEVRHNKTTLNNYWYSLHGVISQMLQMRAELDAGADHHTVAYATPTNDCSWKCPFYQACPMFDDGSAAEEYIDDHFYQIDPYARYEEDAK